MTWRHKSVHACIAGAHILVLGQRTAEVAGPSNTSSTSRVSAAAAAAAGTPAAFATVSSSWQTSTVVVHANSASVLTHTNTMSIVEETAMRSILIVVDDTMLVTLARERNTCIAGKWSNQLTVKCKRNGQYLDTTPRFNNPTNCHHKTYTGVHRRDMMQLRTCAASNRSQRMLSIFSEGAACRRLTAHS